MKAVLYLGVVLPAYLGFCAWICWLTFFPLQL